MYGSGTRSRLVMQLVTWLVLFSHLKNPRVFLEVEDLAALLQLKKLTACLESVSCIGFIPQRFLVSDMSPVRFIF